MNFADPQIWLSLITLALLEIVLGVDNIIFISILAGKLPAAQQARGRIVGLMLALVTRILLLCSIFYLTKLTGELIKVAGHPFSGRDLVLLGGGLFLMWKSVNEIHGEVDGSPDAHHAGKAPAGFTGTVVQIALIDIVFSLDSVITAVGLAQHIAVMIGAIVIAMGVMMAASGAIAGFVNKHPTVKMLALSFLLLVGVVLVADAFGQHIEKGYIYFAMAFSFTVEMLNLKMRARRRHRAALAAAAAATPKPL